MSRKEDFPKSALQIEALAMQHFAIERAKSLMSHKNMTATEYDKENTKALHILKDAMSKIFKECEFKGDESIIQEAGDNKLTCSYTFLALMQTACEDVDRDLNNSAKVIKDLDTYEKYNFSKLTPLSCCQMRF